ncbi:variant erythrocyte surface antigen-1 family protein [Babesia caballi]|uniref:Variant erythrocyte surface antigen-1 family protein n=1 Tax=Babesia caballi TaxID=5871 RepID=A0AAV4LNJ4_BABCB|nr:variant erythrocyte surface antigen-1 family protein [Babesia caballi]
MGEKKLTEPPKDLKEAIDWITWVCGYGQGAHDMKTKLAAAVNSLTDFKTAFKGKFGTVEDPTGLIKKFADGLGYGFLGYNGQGTDDFSGSGIVASNGKYKSAYHNCNWSSDGGPDYAKTFLFLAPLVYYFVTFLYWTCKNKWRNKTIQNIGSVSPLFFFMVKMGFKTTELQNIKGSHIADRLGGHDGFSELVEAYGSGGSSSYSTFIEKLESNGPKNALSFPLASCKRFSYAYLKSRGNGADVTAAIDDIKGELPKLSASNDTSSTSEVSDLQQKIVTLLGKIKTFNPNSVSSPAGSSEPGSDGLQKAGSSGTGSVSSSQSSSAGPAVGGFLGVGALGAGVAYGLNLDCLVHLIRGQLCVVHGRYNDLTLPLYSPLSASLDLSPDCPSNLKEAIDWILRVTGKDGSGGNVYGQKLAQAVTGLPGFTDAITAAAKKLKESGGDGDNVSQALKQLQNDTTLGQIIGKLAEGLATFIGYQNGTIKYSSSGIGLPNDPRERLGDAVLGFLSKVLEQLKTYSEKKYVNRLQLQGDNGNITKAMSALKGGVGGGQQGFNTAILTAKSALESVNYTNISTVWNQLKDVNSYNGPNDLESLANQVKTYLNGVLQQLKQVQGIRSKAENEVSTLKSKLDTFITHLSSQKTNKPFNFGEKEVDGQKGLKQQLDAVVSANRVLNGVLHNVSDDSSRYLISAVIVGTDSFLSQLKKVHYTSYYQGVAVETSGWSGGSSNDGQKCAKILLGCLPMIFSALSYLYWRCDLTHGNGKWNDMPLRGGQNGKDDLKDFLYSMAYGSSILSGSKSGQSVSRALEKFKDFTAGMETAKKSYPDFLKELQKTGRDKLYGQDSLASSTDHSMSILYSTATLYFTGKQIQGANNAEASPSTIREMLYFLAALPFSSEVGELEKHIGNLLSKPLLVSIAGINTTKPLFLTANNINSHLSTTVCLSATSMLGRFQGPGYVGKDNDPFLHNLYSNSIGLRYPSGAALFRCLTGCTYAVQFQMMFLLQQCSGKYSETCGWRDCRFGQGLTNMSVESHLCSVFTKCRTKGCAHDGKKPNATPKCNHSTDCGQKYPSHLQAFLTDNLKGFSRGHPSETSDHLNNHPPGYMCHVKMGFSPATLRKDSGAKGYHIYVALSYICASATSPFRQFGANLLCLTERTPRILGAFFGFHWQMVAARQSSSVLAEIMAYITDVFLQDADKKNFIVAITQMNASKYSDTITHNDLMSLYSPGSSGRNYGPYLEPLSFDRHRLFT